MTDLFSYPSPGKTDTSAAAAVKIGRSADVMRERVYRHIAQYTKTGATPSEVAEGLGLDILNVRPRVTELVQAGRLTKTDQRRKNRKGNSECVVTAA